jgi:hypothetical protein
MCLICPSNQDYRGKPNIPMIRVITTKWKPRIKQSYAPSAPDMLLCCWCIAANCRALTGRSLI